MKVDKRDGLLNGLLLTLREGSIIARSVGLVEEASFDELLEEELDVADLRVLDAEIRQDAHVAVLDAGEDRAQVVDVVAHQSQRTGKVANRL